VQHPSVQYTKHYTIILYDVYFYVLSHTEHEYFDVIEHFRHLQNMAVFAVCPGSGYKTAHVHTYGEPIGLEKGCENSVQGRQSLSSVFVGLV